VTITKDASTGLILFKDGNGFIMASCKETNVIAPITFKSNTNTRGIRVFTGAPIQPNTDAIRYDVIDFTIDELTSIVVASTVYTFTPPQSLPNRYDNPSYVTAYNSVYTQMVTTVFRSCCPTVVNVTGEAVLFYATYGDLPVTGLVDILYVTEDGSGSFIWNTTTLSYDPVYYTHPSLTVFASQNFI
jgi:hypothetical protein